jgi:uncharacterized caspase-like protein
MRLSGALTAELYGFFTDIRWQPAPSAICRFSSCHSTELICNSAILLKMRILRNLLLVIATFCGLAVNGQDKPVFSNFDIHITITEVREGKGDTLWLSLEGGENIGIVPGAKGTAVQVYSKVGSRDYRILSAAKITKAGSTTSTAYVLAPKENKSEYLIKGDQVLFTRPVFLKAPTEEQQDLQLLAGLNIVFLDEYSDPFYTQSEEINSFGYKPYDSLIKKFQADIFSTAATLRDQANKPEAWTTPFDTGKFKGKNLIEALEQTSLTDIEAYLHFVLEFPGKYLGHKWKFNETYATWVINNMPWSADKKYLVRRFLKFNTNETIRWVKENNYYYDTLKQQLTTTIDGYVNAKQYDSAELIISKSLALAQAARDNNFQAVIYTNRAIIAQGKNGSSNAANVFALYKQAIDLDSNYWAPFWYRANFYAELEQYKNAIEDAKVLHRRYPYYATAWGNAGWWSLKQFKIKDAGLYCKTAYNLDSSEMAYAVNLGHFYLLSGQADSARRLYQKTLDNLKTANDFVNGPLSDFAMFAESGIMSNAFEVEKNWMVGEFNATYKHYVQSDSLYAIAKDFYKKSGYAKAVEYFTLSREEEKAAAKKRLLSIHNISTWIGYSQMQNKDFNAAEKTYMEALAMARKDHPAQLSNDMELLGELYNKSGKKALSEAYYSQASAWKSKYEDESSSNDLYIVSVGVDKYKDLDYQWAAEDADKVATAFKSKGKKFANIHTRVLGNKLAISDSVDKAIQDVIRSAKENDYFVFYFTGKATALEKESFLLPYGLNTSDADSILFRKAISARLLRSWSNSINARHQLFILDAAANNFSSAFASQSSAFPKMGSEKDMVIVAAGFPRIEEAESGSSIMAGKLNQLFTDSLFNLNQTISGKKIEQFFTDEISRKNYFLSLESFSQGRDFILAQSDNSGKEMISRGEQTSSGSGFVSRGGDVEVNTTAASGNVVGRKYGLFIATNIYADPKWVRLNNPIQDAQALQKLLEDRYGFEIRMVLNPSKTEIYRIIDEYSKKKFDKNDQLVILFAGHGHYDMRRNEGYLVTSDAKYTDIDYDINYYAMSTLARDLAHIQADHMMVLMDACHGGAICESGFVRGGEENMYSGVSVNDVVRQHLENRNRVILTSGRKDQTVLDGVDGKNSPFIYGILKALSTPEASKQGFVTFNDLVASVNKVQKFSQSTSGKFGTEDNFHFTFFYSPEKKKATTDPSALVVKER